MGDILFPLKADLTNFCSILLIIIVLVCRSLAAKHHLKVTTQANCKQDNHLKTHEYAIMFYHKLLQHTYVYSIVQGLAK